MVQKQEKRRETGTWETDQREVVTQNKGTVRNKGNRNQETAQNKTDGHRCERCNRKLKDQSARLGWRCAEILGTTQGLNRAGDGVFNDFRVGVENANRYFRENKVDTNKINMPKFYQSHVKQRLAASMDNEELWTLARNGMREALNPTYDRYGNIILRQSESPDLDTMFDLRDQVDYKRGRYKTTGFTDNEFNHHALLLQEALNAYGAVDKFGNKLKEDGIFGPKTQWAVDILGGVEAYGATNNVETGKDSNEALATAKRINKNFRKKAVSPKLRFKGEFDGESRTMRDEYWSAKDMPYVGRILNGYPREGDPDLGIFSDYAEIISNASTFMEKDSPLSDRDKALYNEALSEAVDNYDGDISSNNVDNYIKNNEIGIINVPNRELQIEFLESILEGSVSEYLKTGIPWQVTMAQAAQETGWGNSSIVDIYTEKDSNNLYGIKYIGPISEGDKYVRSWTTEYIDYSELSYWQRQQSKWALAGETIINTGEYDSSGKLKIKVIQPFKIYSSKDDSIVGHSQTLSNDVYKNAMEYTNDPYRFLEEISDIYATDPSYYENVSSIITKYLTWDEK